MIHKWKEKCDVCSKWSDSYTIVDNSTPKGLLICDECNLIIDKFNSVPMVNPIRTEDLKKILEKAK